MTFNQIMTELGKKKYSPLYLLMGDEPYYIDRISNYIQNNILTDDEKTFNLTVMYGKDVNVGTIDNSARRFPMMSNKQIVIVKEAQEMRNINDLQYYASKPIKSTILVISHKYKTIAANTKFYKAANTNGVVFSSKKLYDNQVPKWIEDYVKEKEYTIAPDATMLLNEFLGNNLSKVANEIDKLIISHDKSKPIDVKLIEANIGISKDFNNFELQKALGQKDVLKANRIINYFAANPKDNPAILTIISLFQYFNKLFIYYLLKDKTKMNVAKELKINPFFVNDYMMAAKNYNAKKVVEVISFLRDYDLRLKGVNNVSTSQGDLLKELIFKIMH